MKTLAIIFGVIGAMIIGAFLSLVCGMICFHKAINEQDLIKALVLGAVSSILLAIAFVGFYGVFL